MPIKKKNRKDPRKYPLRIITIMLTQRKRTPIEFEDLFALTDLEVKTYPPTCRLLHPFGVLPNNY